MRRRREGEGGRCEGAGGCCSGGGDVVVYARAMCVRCSVLDSVVVTSLPAATRPGESRTPDQAFPSSNPAMRGSYS